jgi:hypothetical protein
MLQSPDTLWAFPWASLTEAPPPFPSLPSRCPSDVPAVSLLVCLRSAGEPMPPHLFAMLARSSAGVRCMQRMSVVSTVWDDAFERSVTPLQRRAALLSLVRKIASAILSWLCLW